MKHILSTVLLCQQSFYMLTKADVHEASWVFIHAPMFNIAVN